ncbi:MAG: tRNA lysidine(34) synthetase TilS, partial [Bacteroidaceae bacterium]|nr:tRNA lysidine(34) synthetase TilS [Bacteroidaceae bacterium]
MKRIQEKVKRYIDANGLLKKGVRVVVGLSGGPDSVCLALMLQELGYEVVAAHANFHLRGEESMRDEAFAQTLAERRGWTWRKADFDTASIAQERKMSIEMAARELRYEWFARVKKETNAEAIAVGHHEEDNVETMLLNAVRGTGIRGLCGMQPRNGEIVRPLLCLTRKEILMYLKDRGQSYVTDHTNAEDVYARNKVRLDVLPTLEDINRGAVKNLVSTQENLGEVMKVYQQAMQEAMTECVEKRAHGETHIHIQKLSSLPSPISLLHEVLAPLGFNKAQMKAILSALDESGRVFAAAGRRVLIDRQHIIVEAEHYPAPEILQEILPIGEVCIQKEAHYAYLDADKLHGELTLRTPQEGDSFAPFCMGGKR